MSIQIDNGDLEWWEMPKPSPQWLEYKRKVEEEREMKWRARMRFQNEARRAKKVLIAERGHKCQHCGRHVARLHAHHIIHIARGGQNDLSNLVLLCADCHAFEHDHGVGR